MNDEIICKVCDTEECWLGEKRTTLLNEWIQPFISHHKLDLKGLKGLSFTPKLLVGSYGAEFLRRKSGESIILISEEMWAKAEENINDLRILQNILQHELAHVHNNNCLAELPGKITLVNSRKIEDISIFVYRLWDEFFDTQLAAHSEPAGLLQAKMTGVLMEKEQLKKVMRDSSFKQDEQRDQMDMLILTATHLAGSYFGNEDLREVIMEGNLRSERILRTVWQISETAGSLLQSYPCKSDTELLPLAQVYFTFLQEANKNYRPFWRKILFSNKFKSLTAFNR